MSEIEELKTRWKDGEDGLSLVEVYAFADLLISEGARLEEENKDLKFKLSCHTVDCIGDYEDLEKRMKELESDLKLNAKMLGRQTDLAREAETKVMELKRRLESKKRMLG